MGDFRAVGADTDNGRDAFGQPLAGERATAPRASAAKVRRPRRSPLPWLFTIAAIAVTAYVLVRSDHDAQQSPTVVTRELGGHALGERSLVRAANFRRALDEVRDAMRPGEVLLSLRLEPEELSTTVRDGNGNTRLIDVGIDYAVKQRDWSTNTSSTPLSLEGIQAAVPEKIVRATLREADADDTHLSYLSLSGGDPPSWYVSLDDVPIGEQAWTADLRGVAVTHPGELPFAQGLDGRSLLRERNLAAALEKVGEHGRRVTSLRLAPDRLDVTLRIDGGTRDVQVDAAQRVTVRDDPGAAASGTPVLVDRIDPAAPGRAFAAAIRQGDLAAKQIDYAVLFSPPAWGLYFQGAPERLSHWQADANGRHVERTG